MKTLLTILILTFTVISSLAVVDPYKNPAFQESEILFDSNDIARIYITMEQEHADMIFMPEIIRDTWSDFPFPVELPDGAIVSPADLHTRYGTNAPNAEFTELWREPWYYYIKYYAPCSMRFQNRFIDETIDNIGIAMRGSGSRLLPKKSVKIDFNYYDDDKLFHQMKKIKLQAEYKDPSMVRSVLSFQQLWQMKCPATRNRHALLYINDVLIGMYVLADHEDKTFLGMHFGSKECPYYQMRNPKYKRLINLSPYRRKPIQISLSPKADLRYREENDYAELGKGWVYEVSDDTGIYGWAPLTNLIHMLEFTPDTIFEEKIEKIFNVDQFLRQMAVMTLIGNGDNYRMAGNNYQMAYDIMDERLVFFTRDHSNTLGIDETGQKTKVRRYHGWDERHPDRYVETDVVTLPIDWAKRRINTFGIYHDQWTGREEAALGPLRGLSSWAWVKFKRNPEYVKWYNQYKEYESHRRPLAERILSRPRYRRRYNQYIADLMAETFNEEVLGAEADRVHTMLAPYMEEVAEDALFPVKQKAFKTALKRPRSIRSSKRIVNRYGGLYAAEEISRHYGGFVTYGIKRFVKKRVKQAKKQLDPKIFALNEICFSSSNFPAIPTPWIEIFNPRFTDEKLTSMYLTDDPERLHKWPLSHHTLPSRVTRTKITNNKKTLHIKTYIPDISLSDSDVVSIEIDGATISIFNSTWTYGKNKAVSAFNDTEHGLHGKIKIVTDGKKAGKVRLAARRNSSLQSTVSGNCTVTLCIGAQMHSHTLYFLNGKAKTETVPYTCVPQKTITARGHRVFPLSVFSTNAAETVLPGTTLYLVRHKEIIDKLCIPTNIPESVSYGRYRDWDSYESLLHPTPNSKNSKYDIAPEEYALVINEFMAGNDETIVNPSTGAYDDWIELKNTGTRAISLKGLYVSDALSSPARYEITDDVTIEPEGYVLIWASGSGDAGPLNMPFKLGKGGEDVVLTGKDGVSIIDAITYGEQEDDISYGRFPDGAGGPQNPDAYIFMEVPTPGAENTDD